MSKPTHADAELVLRLYDLRREEKMRKARQWFFSFPWADNMTEFHKAAPVGSEENAYFRMVVTYWDMAASFVEQGILNEELFFRSNNTELLFVWVKLRHLFEGFRSVSKNAMQYKSIEEVGGRYAAWVGTHSPDAVAVFETRARATRVS